METQKCLQDWRFAPLLWILLILLILRCRLSCLGLNHSAGNGDVECLSNVSTAIPCIPLFQATKNRKIIKHSLLLLRTVGCSWDVHPPDGLLLIHPPPPSAAMPNFPALEPWAQASSWVPLAHGEWQMNPGANQMQKKTKKTLHCVTLINNVCIITYLCVSHKIRPSDGSSALDHLGRRTAPNDASPSP